MDKPSEPDLSESIALMREYLNTRMIRYGKAESTLTAALKLAAAYITALDKQPEIIIGDGVTVLRPGVWYATSSRFGKTDIAFISRGNFLSSIDWTYTRIGDVPGEE